MENTRPISESRLKARIPTLAHYFIHATRKPVNLNEPLNAYQARRGRLILFHLITSLTHSHFSNVTSIVRTRVCPSRAICSE